MAQKTFDLNLGSWGPYNKGYLGVCHVANPALGASFQVELFPGLFRRRILVSRSSSDDGLKMWGANAALTRFIYRYELLWKDQLYCDADFVITGDRRCDITCTFVNNTSLYQAVNMNLCASLQYPVIKSGREVVAYHVPVEPVPVPGCRWIDAVEYEKICCSETLASDGLYLGESLQPGASGKGTAVAGKYFHKPEHWICYTADTEGGCLLIRYLAGEDTKLQVSINGWCRMVPLPKSDKFATVSLEIPEAKGAQLELRPTGKPVTLDCLVLGREAAKTEFRPILHNPEAHRKLGEQCMALSYEGISSVYTIRWHEPAQMVRRYYCTDIGRALSLNIHDHVSLVSRTDNALGVYENVLSEPLFLEPGESRALHFCVTSDEKVSAGEVPALYHVAANPEGKTYAFSQNMMACNTFLNVVYPIYTRRQYIRHNTPGRNWDSLYSWDSGFIGMGLGTADFQRSFECLNTYLTPVGDPHSPYIFHGSVVPTQIFQYQYLFDKYPQYREQLKALYPMIRQYFLFYAHMDRREDQTGSGLLKTWNIFYNSGGWDDYPPQKYLHQATETGSSGPTIRNTTPVITTAVTVLVAKILRNIAAELGMDGLEEYDRIIVKYKTPILAYAWNEETGYFSYVAHDDQGTPVEFLKHADGTDFNQGFDGIYPYIAGITDEKQDARILANIQQGLMTPNGVGVVDTRASYYSSSGYWNGSVWMPHQWILWRALFDHGQGALAFEIADTALKLWKREVEDTYCCFEHFMSTGGRGSGFHQFSGLSTPVLLFFESYYTPGTVTLGFESLVRQAQWNPERTALTLRCRCAGKQPVALVCMAAGKTYRFSVNGQPVAVRQVTDGAYEVPLSRGEVTLTAEV